MSRVYKIKNKTISLVFTDKKKWHTKRVCILLMKVLKAYGVDFEYSEKEINKTLTFNEVSELIK